MSLDGLKIDWSVSSVRDSRQKNVVKECSQSSIQKEGDGWQYVENKGVFGYLKHQIIDLNNKNDC